VLRDGGGRVALRAKVKANDALARMHILCATTCEQRESKPTVT
jgi:hypothetical protein